VKSLTALGWLALAALVVVLGFIAALSLYF